LKRIGLEVEWRTTNGISFLWVSSVEEGSVSEDAGLMEEDIIKMVNGEPVRGVADFNKHLSQPTGTILRIVAFRDEELEISLRLP
jgi:C-terminal processing protease CtpA/Prc